MANYTPLPKDLKGDIGVANKYLVEARDITEYSAFRGVTDFSQISQFTPYEGGYQYLALIKMPKFMEELANENEKVRKYYNAFKHIVEYEFKGLDGLPDLNSDTFTITDGINDIRMISRVTEDTSISVSATYTERIGSPLTRFARLYLTGIKDPKTQAKTYHGLIANGTMVPDLANEIFTMMYIATDNTMLRVEKAVLLCNMQLTKAEESIYNGNRSDIGATKDITIEWNAYPVTSSDVDALAAKILYRISGVKIENGAFVRTSKQSYAEELSNNKTIYRPVAELDSADYGWAVIKKNQAARVGNSYGDDKNQQQNKAFIPEAANYGIKSSASKVNKYTDEALDQSPKPSSEYLVYNE